MHRTLIGLVAVLPLMQAIHRDEKGVGRFEAVMKIDAASLYRFEP